MGVATDFIWNHISKLADEAIFATRDMLGYGSRAAVDRTLGRLVKEGVLTRLARGLFMKNSAARGTDTPLPSLATIVKAKAAAFKRNVMTSGKELAQALGVRQKNQPFVEFAVDGWSSSFKTVHGRVKLRQVAKRNMFLGETLVGKCLRGFWRIGEKYLTKKIATAQTVRFGREDRAEMRSRTDALPQWLTEFLDLPLQDSSGAHSEATEYRRRDSEFDPSLGFLIQLPSGEWIKKGPKRRNSTD